MDKKTSWFFAPTSGGSEEKFNHSGMAHFTSKPHYFVARETIQNSLDAKNEKRAGEPAVVEFRLVKASTSDIIPDLDNYKSVLNECINASSSDSKASKFFKDALKKVQKQSLPVLVISDYSTTGIESVNKEDGRWYNLIKLKGESKAEGFVGGTFGIGKSAPYTVSGLRTVCYNTKNIQGEDGFIWKSIFTNHGRPRKQNEGYYCESFEDDIGEVYTHGFTNENKVSRPSFISRESEGTDLLIIDFLGPQDTKQPWNVVFHKAVMNNYFIAIYRNELKVRFVDEMKNIDYELSSTNIVDEMKKDYNLDSKTSNYPYLDCYVDYENSGKLFQENIKSLGTCSLYVKIDEDYDRKVAYMRAPKMLVYDAANANMNRGYRALFICETKTGNTFLSQTEGPTHDEWAKGWHKDPQKASKLLRRLNTWVNTSLRSLSLTNYSAETMLGELDHLSYEEEESSGKGKSQSENISNNLNNDKAFELDSYESPSWVDVHYRKPKTKKSRKRKKIIDSKEGFGPGDDDNEFGKGGQTEDPTNVPNPDPKIHPGPGLSPGGGDGNQKLKNVPKSQYNYRCFNKNSSGKYNLIISTKNDKKCNIIFFARGLDSDKNEIVNISNAENIESGEQYKVLGNSIIDIETSKNPLNIAIQTEITRRVAIEIVLLA